MPVDLRRMSRMIEEHGLVGIHHVTLNPREQGAVHIHLVQPQFRWFGKAEHLVFLNGWWVLPVSPSEARLLRYFMEELELTGSQGKEISDPELAKVLVAVSQRMSRMYPHVKQVRFQNDLVNMVGVFLDVAQHREPSIEVHQKPLTLAEYARHMRAPHRMDLIVTPMTLDGQWTCPNHCPNCYAKGQPAMEITDDEVLSTSQWKEILDSLWKVGVPQVSFTGGEPLTRGDLVELIAHAERFVTRLNTSGIGLTPEVSKSLYEASLDAIQVTMYSADPSIHDKLVGNKGAWQQTVQGIQNAVEAGLYVSVNCPLVRTNAPSFNELIKFVHGLGVCYVSCSGLIPTGGATHTLGTGGALSNLEIFSTLSEAVKVCAELGIEISFTSPGWLKEEQLKSLGLDVPICGACLSNMAIAPNGAVMPCQSWLSDAVGLGNILTTPWRKIWGSKKCRGIRSQALDNNCPLGDLKEVKK